MMGLLSRLWNPARACERKGHDWFPNMMAREFTVVRNRCLRCGHEEALMPYGDCLSGHPIAEHYVMEGAFIVSVGKCKGPQ